MKTFFLQRGPTNDLTESNIEQSDWGSTVRDLSKVQATFWCQIMLPWISKWSNEVLEELLFLVFGGQEPYNDMILWERLPLKNRRLWKPLKKIPIPLIALQLEQGALGPNAKCFIPVDQSPLLILYPYIWLFP